MQMHAWKERPPRRSFAVPHNSGKDVDLKFMATVAALTTTLLTTTMGGAPAGNNQASATRTYQLRKPLAAVHFDQAGTGRIVFLPEGAELHIIGSSSVRGCFEVKFENGLYNVFQADLQGPRSSRIEPNRVMAARAVA